jgi:hypothetical protein
MHIIFMEPKIERFILDLPDDLRPLAMRVRDIFLSVKGVGETLKWGQLTFEHGGKSFAFVYRASPKAGYLNLGFFKATSLSDPKKLFEGTGKGMRHIKIAKEKDIPAAQVKKWVKEAVGL